MNTDIRLKVGFFHHTKIVRLERRIGAAGVLSLLRLFAYAAQNKPDGNLSGLDDEEIEIAAGWTGKQGEMIDACVSLKLLDKSSTGYLIHDWHTHQPWAAGAEKRSEQARKAAKYRWEKPEQKQPSNADSMQPADNQHADSNAPSPDLSLPYQPKQTPTSGGEKLSLDEIKKLYKDTFPGNLLPPAHIIDRLKWIVDNFDKDYILTKFEGAYSAKAKSLNYITNGMVKELEDKEADVELWANMGKADES